MTPWRVTDYKRATTVSNTTHNEERPHHVPTDRDTLAAMLRAHYESAQQVRRGVCLLRAGQYGQASAAFNEALRHDGANQSLPCYLAACMLGQGRSEAAVEQFAKVAAADRTRKAAQIRYALALWAASRREEAVASLRQAVDSDPECAELHFQLGTLLSALEQYEEAQLRFGQALSIDRDHTEALVSMAMCCGLCGAPAEALKLLQRAQALKPHDPRIGLLLGQAAAALKQRGQAVHIRATMPGDDSARDEAGIEELSRAIEVEPDFVEAFTSFPPDKIDERVFAILAKALDAILTRRPGDAELHARRGRVLKRLGRRDEAIRANERAVENDPKCLRALIELGRLYAQTDRQADAATRLEQAVAAGADYADVHFLLGNLYRDQGLVVRARKAYRRALVINEQYEAALAALKALPA